MTLAIIGGVALVLIFAFLAISVVIGGSDNDMP